MARRNKNKKKSKKTKNPKGKGLKKLLDLEKSLEK